MSLQVYNSLDGLDFYKIYSIENKKNKKKRIFILKKNLYLQVGV